MSGRGLTGSAISIGSGVDFSLALPASGSGHLLQLVYVLQAEAWVEGEVDFAYGNGKPRSHPGPQLLKVLVVQYVESVVPGESRAPCCAKLTGALTGRGWLIGSPAEASLSTGTITEDWSLTFMRGLRDTPSVSLTRGAQGHPFCATAQQCDILTFTQPLSAVLVGEVGSAVCLPFLSFNSL